ncbi:MAG: hypothetical protein ABSF64_37810 [Bryobacteraceae bacterium]|jgi:hypothetical protein
MNTQTKQAGILALAILAVVVAPAKAGVTLVKSRAAMDGNDLINWAQLGPTLTVVPTPAPVTTNGGLRVLVSNLGGSSVVTDKQGDPWDGNFAPNAPIIATGQLVPSGSISIAFATPVSAVGAQMGYNNAPETLLFTEVITAYDFDGNLLGTFTVNGKEDTDANNSAVFIGIEDSIPEISTVVFSTTTFTGAIDPGAIAINNVTLVVPAGCETKRK